jgi:hypothetical protein
MSLQSFDGLELSVVDRDSVRIQKINVTAQHGDAVLVAKAFEDDADLLLGREMSPGGSPDIADSHLRARRSLLVALSQGDPPRDYYDPQTLSYAISSSCPAGPDGEQQVHH